MSKSLQELSVELGFPFQALDTSRDGNDNTMIYNCIGISPTGKALGWYLDDLEPWYETSTTKCWQASMPKKELIEVLYLEVNLDTYETEWFENQEQSDAFFHSFENYKFIKILRKIEIDAKASQP